MRILTVANNKGGSGKSSTAAFLAQAAVRNGRRALLIDLDPQASLSFMTGGNANKAGTFEMLQGQPAEGLIQATPSGADIIPASWNLATISSSRGSAKRLQTALEPLAARYDICFIDTPPTSGELLYNALQAATDLIIPLQANPVEVQGLYQISSTAQQIQITNPRLRMRGILITRYKGRSTLEKQTAEVIQSRAREMGIPFIGAIREGIAAQEAQALQLNIFDYAPKSKPAQDYLSAFAAIMEE